MNMPIDSNILGIDIGSVSVSVVEVSPTKEILKTAYKVHHGKPAKLLKNILNEIGRIEAYKIASTSSTPSIIKTDKHYDNMVSVIYAARHFHHKIGSILIVGGEKFGIIHFNEKGEYINYRTNTSCAAGTGSFLDQQAQRLNLTSIEELSEIAFKNSGSMPKIASRCAVFAKTDLVHAQQAGYSLREICDGLCHGLSKNIIDTLFITDETNSPIIFTGGVSKNMAVIKHIQDIVGKDVVKDEYSHLYGAIGSAFNLADELADSNRLPAGPKDDVVIHKTKKKKYFHDPLQLSLSEYPDFSGVEKYEYSINGFEVYNPVEVDIYKEPEASLEYEVYMGIDVGSTSTKAAISDKNGNVLSGFYTRTAGKPLDALQQIFAAIDNFAKRKKISFQFMGTGTTGAGRKFIGKIIGADIVIDEITSHARAAYELNPGTDTIIEIGGQDSKFTTLKNGMVTFSIMNNVCAAGTGSFIEEQAQKLQCHLSDYSSRTEGKRSPISSDRCTVFMERDINHYLSEGYSVDEVLASVLHSIRENYLTKVAIENSIGNAISFQGATAKNKALVAAFEQRLKKPIYVSKYCHLTGALGAALILSDQGISETGFRGIKLYQRKIPIKSEVCEICTNHCKITLADIDGEKVAYGFLCGRDYETKKYVNNNISGFDLIKERKKIFSFKPGKNYGEEFTIGIPAALHLYEDLPIWKKFFKELSIKIVTSERYKEAVKEGKYIAGAEFCAPVTALHGHVKYLSERADYIFLPFYIEKRVEEKGIRRQYCYYTQFSPSLASTINIKEGKGKLLMPLVNYLYGTFHAKVQLYLMLKSISKNSISFFDVSTAYDKAIEFKKSSLSKLRNIYQIELRKTDDIHVVFLGRPYTILSEAMNKGIVGIFASLGIKTFFQDMLSYSKEDVKSIEPLLKEFHWQYASKILEAAQVVAKNSRVYPVLITSFRCSPDSFVIDYFKKIMESHGKPYLILQLDEHDSSLGYETRIEAAIRAFKNHDSSQSIKATTESIIYKYSPISKGKKHLLDKTLLIPNWDRISQSFIVANLQREGIDARLLEGSETSIQKSLRHNTGQCTPLNIVAQEFIDYIERHNLDPAKTALWMSAAEIACNIKLYPYHIKSILNYHGNGLEKADVYVGSLSFADISMKLPVNTYFGYMFGGFIRKIGCKIRPYEKFRGTTDRTIEKSINILTDAFLGNRSKEDALSEVILHFENIGISKEKRPKVAVFGDLYARDNEVINQNLIHFIEDNGGEVITMPYSSFVKMITRPYLRKWFIEGRFLNVLSYKTLITRVRIEEKTYYKYFERILNEPDHEYNESPEKILSEYNIRIENAGESMENILKVFYIKKYYPDISLFVQTSPAFCCPSLVTEAMARKIEKNTGVPIVSITYDGIGGNKNDVIIPYIKFPRESHKDKDGRNVLQHGYI